MITSANADADADVNANANASVNANANANAERKEAVAPAVEATRVTGVGVREEVPEEAVDDEYARMMAELGG